MFYSYFDFFDHFNFFYVIDDDYRLHSYISSKNPLFIDFYLDRMIVIFTYSVLMPFQLFMLFKYDQLYHFHLLNMNIFLINAASSNL
jgi:hypothetical protein